MFLQQGGGCCYIADLGDIYLDDVMLHVDDHRSGYSLVVLGIRHRSMED